MASPPKPANDTSYAEWTVHPEVAYPDFGLPHICHGDAGVAVGSSDTSDIVFQPGDPLIRILVAPGLSGDEAAHLIEQVAEMILGKRAAPALPGPPVSDEELPF